MFLLLLWTNVDCKVIKVALSLDTLSEFGAIALKERKMSVSAFLMNEAD